MSVSHVKKRSKKRPIALLTIAFVLVGGSVAYGFWSVTGAGNGASTTATATTALVINQTSTISNLAPGSPAQTLAGNFNNSNAGPVYVQNVVVGAITVTKATGAVAGTCDATDYTVTGGTMTVNAQIPSGNAQGSWTGATIAFNNKSANQDQCKGATLSIAYSSN